MFELVCVNVASEKLGKLKVLLAHSPHNFNEEEEHHIAKRAHVVLRMSTTFNIKLFSVLVLGHSIVGTFSYRNPPNHIED